METMIINPSKVRILLVSENVLLEMMKLPADVRIVGASMSDNRAGQIQLKICSDAFSAVPCGEKIPYVNAHYETGVPGGFRFAGWV